MTLQLNHRLLLEYIIKKKKNSKPFPPCRLHYFHSGKCLPHLLCSFFLKYPISIYIYVHELKLNVPENKNNIKQKEQQQKKIKIVIIIIKIHQRYINRIDGPWNGCACARACVCKYILTLQRIVGNGGNPASPVTRSVGWTRPTAISYFNFSTRFPAR